jgi:rhodanese-related sulfurtransferase
MKTIAALELKALLEADRSVDILDIRPRAQFESGHIDGSHWLMSPRVSAETVLFARELLPTEPLYLVSGSGALAQLSACELKRQGLGNVVVLAGGIHAWQAAALPVARGHGPVRLKEFA